MATLKDVAEASGLTVGTVSRVLNNRGYISPKTREKVYQVMKELNYQPNETARTLAKQKSNFFNASSFVMITSLFCQNFGMLGT